MTSVTSVKSGTRLTSVTSVTHVTHLEMSHTDNVEKTVGEDVVYEINEYVLAGHISDQNMKDFAQQLGKIGNDPNKANIVYGRHRERMERDRNKEKSAELYEILSDWWDEELSSMPRNDALEKLIKIFSSRAVPCKPLAGKLRKHLTSDVSDVSTKDAAATTTTPTTAATTTPTTATSPAVGADPSTSTSQVNVYDET